MVLPPSWLLLFVDVSEAVVSAPDGVVTLADGGDVPGAGAGGGDGGGADEDDVNLDEMLANHEFRRVNGAPEDVLSFELVRGPMGGRDSPEDFGELAGGAGGAGGAAGLDDEGAAVDEGVALDNGSASFSPCSTAPLPFGVGPAPPFAPWGGGARSRQAGWTLVRPRLNLSEAPELA